MAKKRTDFQIEKYNETYLLCRDVRHSWTIRGYFKQGRYVRRQLQCERCLMERTDTWTPSGGRIKASYGAPSDYYVAGGLELADVRREQMNRVTVFESEESMVAALFGGQ